MAEKLNFEKMWETSNTLVFDIEVGSILPLLQALKKVTGHSERNWMLYYDGLGQAYYEKNDIHKAGELGKKLFTDKNFVKKYFKEVEDITQRQVDICNKIRNTNLSKLNNEELKNIFKLSVDLIVDNFGYYATCQQQYFSILEEDIKKELLEFIPENKITDVFTLLSSSTKITKIRQEEIDWLNLLIKHTKRQIENLQKEIENHHLKYFILSFADGNRPFSVDYYVQKFEKDSENSLSELKENLKKISNSLNDIEIQKQEIIKEYSLLDEIVEKCNTLAEIGHYRLDMRISSWLPAYYYNEFVLEEIGNRYGYSVEEIRLSRVEEILKLFENNTLEEKELKKRKERFLFLIKDGKDFIHSGDEAKKKFNEIIQKEDFENLKEIKGNTAMMGNVSGKALVFKWSDNLNEKLKAADENSILVTGQTRPQIMPLISKCKAIVTDEGGITSHAAIVSRELRKPCIIGTKIATEVIKDGDFINVDANSGIVKILN